MLENRLMPKTSASLTWQNLDFFRQMLMKPYRMCTKRIIIDVNAEMKKLRLNAVRLKRKKCVMTDSTE